MRPIKFTRQLAAGAVGAICASQTPGGAGNLVINGSLAAGGVATLAAQQRIGFTSAGNDSTINFTITGTDDQGRTISEVLVGPNANTVQSVLDYLTITRIAVSGAAAAALTVDTVGVGSSTAVPLDRYSNPFLVSLAVLVTGTLNYTVQYTYDDIFTGVGPYTWFSVGSLTNQTANGNASLTAPVTAIRLLTNSGTGTGTLEVVQQGIA